MTIKISDPKIVPELRYENVFILGFKASQPKGQDQIFKIEYEYILYAINSEGKKIFDESSRVSDTIDNFEETIGAIVNEQDRIDLAGSIAGIEQALATLIRIRQENIDSTEVVV